eukprot:INCI15193.1.p1 GENE.INCI15193.1~~INCI15193.1.p1  ORF type:complete len:336 (+),score=59.04 INCI15193.1:151-1158(+)
MSQNAAAGGESKTAEKAMPNYTPTRVIDKGSFGVVFEARVDGSPDGRIVAIKKVLQDPRYKNRELQIMKMLNNSYVCCMENHFLSSGKKKDQVYLNLVLQFMPTTLYTEIRRLKKAGQTLDFMDIRSYCFQLCAGLNYVHTTGICHRDIKPQNILIDPVKRTLKVCDFGSAKMLEPGQPNIAYICSRYYRAPELIFGAEEYTTAVDMWSAGCVVAECVLASPLFAGKSMIAQLGEIMKVLGTPTKQEILAMNPKYDGFKLPQVPRLDWNKVFRPDKRGRHVLELVTFVQTFIQYVPTKRPTAAQELKHPFFAPLLKAGAKYSNGQPVQKFGGSSS